jgi:hypothetical protein
MTDKVSASAIVCLLLNLSLLPPELAAAQQTIQAEQDEALELIEAALAEHQVNVLKQATTTRFALIYGQHSQGSFVTLALRQLPQRDGQLDLIVTTDSPNDPALEVRILRALHSASSSEGFN